jgi:hypothetical protein
LIIETTINLPKLRVALPTVIEESESIDMIEPFKEKYVPNKRLKIVDSQDMKGDKVSKGMRSFSKISLEKSINSTDFPVSDVHPAPIINQLFYS